MTHNLGQIWELFLWLNYLGKIKFKSNQLWQSYGIGATELCQHYQIRGTNIKYLSALINRHGLAILDQPFTTYTSDFKEQALKQIIVDHEPANQVSIDLKKKDKERDNREIIEK